MGTPDLLVLRPQPGAGETLRRAEKLGLSAIASPIFDIRPLSWRAPDAARFDAVVVTSRNALLHGGPALALYTGLPCYAVGPATARAAGKAGFSNVITGPGDGEALIDLAGKDGVRNPFHPCGREHVPLGLAGGQVAHQPVYAADPVDRLAPEAVRAAEDGALVLIHSPRGGRHFADLWDSTGIARGRLGIAAISEATAAAAGTGWRRVAVARAPRDEALLELAADLCKDRGEY